MLTYLLMPILQLFLTYQNFFIFLLEVWKKCCNFAKSIDIREIPNVHRKHGIHAMKRFHKRYNYGKEETDTIRNDELRGRDRRQLLLR